MKISDGIKLVFKRTGVKQKDLASDLGYKSGAAITNVISRENITVDTLVRICNELGYSVILRPSVVKPSEAEIVIDAPKKDGVGQ